MSILFKAVPKGQPGVVGGGEIKYYAGIIRERPVEMRKFATEIAGRCTLTTSDIFGVLESFLERMHAYIEDGRIVKLGDFGSFAPYIGSQGEVTPEEVDRYSIRKTSVRFRPGKELRSRLSQVSYDKISSSEDAAGEE